MKILPDFFGIFLMAALFQDVANAATKRWIASGTDTSWGNGVNWDPSGAPTDLDRLVFPISSAVKKSGTATGGDYNYTSIRFLDSGYSMGGRAYSALWSAEQATGGVIFSGFITSNYGNAEINVLNAAANIRFIDIFNVDNGKILTVSGAGNTEINRITCPAGATPAAIIKKTGSGTLTLTGNNAFAGGVLYLDGGFLEAAQSSVPQNYTTYIKSGATLLGRGMSGAIVNRGILAPGGPGATANGALIVNGTIVCPTDTPDTSSKVVFRLRGTTSGSYDSITRYTAADFRGAALTLDIHASFSPPMNSTYTLISGGDAPAALPFKDLPEGKLFNVGRYIFSITYRGEPKQHATIITRVPIPVPEITDFQQANGNFSFKIKGFPQSRFNIEKSTDLAKWNAFGNIVVLDSLGEATVTASMVGDNKAYYRAVAVEVP